MLAVVVRSRIGLLLCLSLLSAGCLPHRSAEQDPKRDPNYLRGQNLLSQLDYDGATRAFNRALAANPASAPAHFELGFLCKDRADDPASAIYHFQQFLTLQPDSDQARLIRRHVDNCKMELAKLFLIAPVVPDSQRELDRLKEVVKDLQRENESLRRELALIHSPPPAPPARKPGTLPAAKPSSPVEPSGRSLFAETPLPVPTQPAPSPPKPATKRVSYTIKNGDYPAKIARKYGVELEALLKANPGINPRRLKIGEKVTIPAG